MTHSSPVSFLGSEFDDFLFAPIGEDRNGTPVSVLSALARRDVDPWREAAELARLPLITATERLASLISALPDRRSAQQEPETIAAQLVTRLPRHVSSNIPLRDKISVENAMILLGVLMILAVGTLCIIAYPLASVDAAHVPAPNTILPQMPPPSPGQ